MRDEGFLGERLQNAFTASIDMFEILLIGSYEVMGTFKFSIHPDTMRLIDHKVIITPEQQGRLIRIQSSLRKDIRAGLTSMFTGNLRVNWLGICLFLVWYYSAHRTVAVVMVCSLNKSNNFLWSTSCACYSMKCTQIRHPKWHLISSIRQFTYQLILEVISK